MTLSIFNEIPLHFIRNIKTKGYDVIDVTVFRKLMRFLREKRPNWFLYYYCATTY